MKLQLSHLTDKLTGLASVTLVLLGTQLLFAAPTAFG
jgi:hypothetical protein